MSGDGWMLAINIFAFVFPPVAAVGLFAYALVTARRISRANGWSRHEWPNSEALQTRRRAFALAGGLAARQKESHEGVAGRGVGRLTSEGPAPEYIHGAANRNQR
jgi:hypothetical protein